MAQKVNNQNIEDIIALSPTQEGILFHCLKEPEVPLYLSQVALHITGELDAEILQKALNWMAVDNDCLRSVIRWENLSQPVQIVLKQQKLILSQEDLSTLSPADTETRLSEIGRREQNNGFDLTKGPLLRTVLCKKDANSYTILLQFHHIILDGWSLGLFLSEWLQTYELLLHDQHVSRSSKSAYKAYIKWLQQYDHEQARQFWQTELESLSSYTKLPYAQQTRTQGGDIHKVEIDLHSIFPQVEEFSRAYSVSASSIMNAAWALLLQRYNDSNEVVYGLTVSGRPDVLPQVERMIGLFINTIPVIVSEAGDLSIIDYIRHIHNKLIHYKKSENLPLSDIQSISRMKGTETLFNHILVFENYPLDMQLLQGSFSSFNIIGYEEYEVNHYDLTVSFLLAGRPMLKLEYHSDLFEQWIVHKMGEHFISILQQFMNQAELPVAGVELLTEVEKQQLLVEFNQTDRMDLKQDKTVYQFFVEQSQATPEYTAVVFQESRLTYCELAQQAERLAGFLRDRGAGEGRIIALLMDWSTDLITAIMGVLGSGSAYLPIDPSYPEERIRYIVESSKVSIIVTMEQYQEVAAAMVRTTVVLEQGDCRLVENTAAGQSVAADHGGVDFPLAYVIYTSGSTGTPKGVMIDQRSFTEFILWTLEEYDHTPGYQVLLSNSYAFDSSIQQIFSPLVSGGTLHLLHPDVRKNADQYMDYLQKHRINSIDEIPVLMNMLVEQAEERSERPVLPDLTSLSLGSEYVPISLVRKCREILNPTGKIINGYGPAETTVETSTYHFDGNSEHEISLIGKPRSNLKIYIVDRNNRLCPIGIPGEICVSGTGLSRGYLGQPELTAERFIPNPFSDIPGDKMYKTGDVGQWQKDGNLQYLGRVDNQVKIRGYRVEIGEIEEALLQHPQIQDAVVVLQGKALNNPVLCAFLKSRTEPSTAELRQFLADKLPSYMIPSFYQYSEAYPLSPNGKINRKALENTEIVRTGEDYSEPRHELDQKLVDIWKNVLNLSHVGIQSNFFELGGNSIQIMRLYNLLKKELPEIKLEISDLFSYNTIAQLADYIMQPADDILSEPENKDRLEQSVQPGEGKETSKAGQDIAIIGIGIHLPEIDGPDQFWDMLVNGQTTIREIPSSRKLLDPTGYRDKNYLRYGYLEGIDEFDPQFFGISPKLAKSMDPNQRIMLETAYHTLEDAGYTREELHNRPVGVFMAGIIPTYYQHLNLKIDELMSSNLPANLAGRLSYHFGFNGPSMVIETACSSSLTAVHTAVQALRNGECELALAGGIHLDIEPIERELAMESNIVSPSECCRAFSEQADGTIGGEGSVCILLKPLEQAVRHNDRVYAVIKGSAITQDGARSNGITAPSPDAQAETLLKAWSNANIDPTTISYIEAHGTGTRLGDPIEIKGIQKAFMQYTDRKQFIRLGSLKSNVGHLDSAAGLAGLVKTALSLQHNELPASLHATPLNSLIPFEQTPVLVNGTLSSWQPVAGEPLRAGVSSFGLSGTNVHIILEKFEPQSVLDGPQNGPDPDQVQQIPYLFTLSGSTPAIVQRKIDGLRQHLMHNHQAALADISYTLNCRRSQDNYRFAVVAHTRKELIERLEQAAEIHARHGQTEARASLWLQDYIPGAERLYDQLVLTGWINREQRAQYDEYIAASSDDPQLRARAIYASFLYAIVSLLQATGLNYELSGIGIGAAVSNVIQNKGTLANVTDAALHTSLAQYNTNMNEQQWFAHRGILLTAGAIPIHQLLDTASQSAEGSSIPPQQWEADVFGFTQGDHQLLTVLSHLYKAGWNLDLTPIQTGNVVSLPVYPFERKSYWFDMNTTKRKALEVRHQEQKETGAVTSELLHRLYWKPTQLQRERKHLLQGVLLIVGEHSDWQEQLANKFRGEGMDVVQMYFSPQYRQLERQVYEVNINEEDQIADVLKQLRDSGQIVNTCIHISSSQPLQDRMVTDRKQLSAVVDGILAPAWYLTRQLALHTAATPARLFHITRNADKVASGDAIVDPLQSFIVSLNRSANHEYPLLESRCIDLEASEWAKDVSLQHIYNEVCWHDETKEVAYRHATRYVRYLNESVPSKTKRELFRNDGVYLVTGGTGGIATEICRAIASKYRATFVLLGRTREENMSQRQLADIRALAELGADVQYFAVNIAERNELESTVERISTQYGNVDGVIHAAGVLGKRVSLLEASMEDYQDVYEAKVYGTVLLDMLLREHMVDFFMTFSSVDAILSEKNLGPYTSANHFMDQYALQQRQLGRQFISIQWGGWQFTGMGSKNEELQSSHIHEIARLSPLILGYDRKQGIGAFWTITGARSSHLMVTGLDEQDLQALDKQAYFKLEPDLRKRMNASSAKPSIADISLESIESTVARVWTEMLEMEQAPDVNENYFSIGGDSILGIDITVQLSQIYQLQLDANTLFRYDTIRSLSRFIHEQLQDVKPASKIRSSIPKAVPMNQE